MSEKLASVEARQAAERIRELAKKATQGDWQYDGQQFIFQDETSAMIAEIRGWGADLGLDDNGRFIAAANPKAITEILDAYTALADSYADITRERDEARNCTVCSYCGEIQRHIDSWEKKVDAILAHIETCPKSPLKQLLDAKQALEAAESLNRELVAERDKLRLQVTEILNKKSSEIYMERMGSDNDFIQHQAQTPREKEWKSFINELKGAIR